MQYLLHFITIRTTITSGHKLYRKTLAVGWEIPSQNPKKLTDEAASTEPILYGVIEKVKQFMGDLLKSRKLSTHVYSYHKMNSFTSPIWADYLCNQHNGVTLSYHLHLKLLTLLDTVSKAPQFFYDLFHDVIF